MSNLKIKYIVSFFLTFILTPTHSFAFGYVDIYSVTSIAGWACDKRFPDDIVAVHVWRDDNKFLGGTSAQNNREPAVGAACGSAHSAHGFSMQMSIEENMNDGKEHKVYIYSIGRDGFVEQLQNSPVNIKFPGKAIQEYPGAAGNIVARDLAVPLLGDLGHIGFWDGAYVIEALDEPQSIKKNTYENFHDRTKVWPIAKPKWPNHTVTGCFSANCTEYINPNQGKQNFSAIYAMVARANQIHVLGADYITTVYALPAIPRVTIPADFPYSPAYNWPPRRGKYRCDTFVIDILGATVRSRGYIHGEIVSDASDLPTRLIQGDISNWYSKYLDVNYMNVKTPLTLYNKLKGWN